MPCVTLGAELQAYYEAVDRQEITALLKAAERIEAVLAHEGIRFGLAVLENDRDHFGRAEGPKAEDAAEPSAIRAGALSEYQTRGNETILVVEDEPAILYVTQNMNEHFHRIIYSRQILSFLLG